MESAVYPSTDLQSVHISCAQSLGPNQHVGLRIQMLSFVTTNLCIYSRTNYLTVIAHVPDVNCSSPQGLQLVKAITH